MYGHCIGQKYVLFKAVSNAMILFSKMIVVYYCCFCKLTSNTYLNK